MVNLVNPDGSGDFSESGCFVESFDSGEYLGDFGDSYVFLSEKWDHYCELRTPRTLSMENFLGVKEKIKEKLRKFIFLKLSISARKKIFWVMQIGTRLALDWHRIGKDRQRIGT